MPYFLATLGVLLIATGVAFISMAVIHFVITP